MEEEYNEIQAEINRKKEKIDKLTMEILEDHERLGIPLPFSLDVVCNKCKKDERSGKIQELKEKKQMILERIKETDREAQELPEPEPQPSKLQELRKRREEVKRRIKETQQGL